MINSETILSALCESPSFLEDLPEADTFDRKDLVLPVKAHALNVAQKLGYLYEDALVKLLESSARYTVLEQGLQLQEGKHRTIGELDFLFRDEASGKLIHLELAVKFYLAIQTETELLLPGPDARDNYYNKLKRLRAHQLTLPHRFRALLPLPYQQESIQTQHLVIGCLFDHIREKSLARPEFINPQVRRGKWLRQAEYLEHFPSSATPLIIPKPLWPVALERLESVDLEPLDLTLPLDRCTMVKVEGYNAPLFIAPDCYPEQ